MDQLRWILLLIGAGIIAVIYLAGRYREQRNERKRWQQEQDGSGIVLDTKRSSARPQADHLETELRELGSKISISAHDIEPESAPVSPRPKEAVAAAPQPSAEKIVVIYVVAPSGSRFRGDAILQVAREAGLEYGEMGIFHGYSDTESGSEAVYSMANMVEPGRFDLATMADLETPGLALFLRLPGPLEGASALDVMLQAAERLQRELQGELRDASRSVLSKQTVAHLREEVREFSRKRGIVGSRSR